MLNAPSQSSRCGENLHTEETGKARDLAAERIGLLTEKGKGRGKDAEAALKALKAADAAAEHPGEIHQGDRLGENLQGEEKGNARDLAAKSASGENLQEQKTRAARDLAAKTKNGSGGIHRGQKHGDARDLAAERVGSGTAHEKLEESHSAPAHHGILQDLGRIAG